MLLLQNFMIKLSCLSENSDVHTLNHIYLRIVTRYVPQMFFVESVFIIVVMGCRDKVIRHHNYCTEIVILLMSIKLLEVVQ